MSEKAKKKSELAKKRGARVKECRKEAKLTQKELAIKCNYGDDDGSGNQYICKIERGERPLNSWDVAMQLSEVLNVDPRYLMCEVDYKSIDAADLNQIRLLKKEYQSLKYKLGRIPHLKEFDEMGELDPLRLIDKKGS